MAVVLGVNFRRDERIEWHKCKDNDTWWAIMNEFELDLSDDTMRFYWDWIRSYFRIGNKPDCRPEMGGVRINCPFTIDLGELGRDPAPPG